MEKKYVASMKKIHDRLYKFLIRFDKIAKENNIEYWLIGGAAIGALREGDFLEWDDDLDIIIKEEDVERFQSMEWEKYGWSLKNPVKTPHSNINKLYLLDTKVKINGYDDFLFVDVFTGYKQRDISKMRRVRMLAIDYIWYIKSYGYKEIAEEYGQIWRLVKFIFSLYPGSEKYLRSRWRKILKKGKIISDKKRKFYFAYDGELKNKNCYHDLSGYETGKIRDIIVPIPYEISKTTKSVFGDIMEPPKNKPQKPDHNVEIL